MEDLILILDSEDDIELSLDSELDLILETDAAIVTPYSHYDGEYEVIPILYDDQVLETNNKIMDDNVTVRPIPVVETSNLYGGKTVVIG